MKYAYIAISVQENKKSHAYVIKASESDNLLSKLKIKGIQHANIFPTKKEAELAASFWNTCYKLHGIHMFS